jgi:hypothetical protein
LLVAAAPLVASADETQFEAHLRGKNEVPPVVTDGEGEVEFTVKRSKIRFELEWEDLTSPAVAAHIHCAVKGVNGPVGVTLFAGTMDTDGRVKGSFTAPDPGNTCGWATNADVLAAMISGGAYVNVHSQDFPGGEIRGQVKIEDLEFESNLRGKREVPPVATDGEGEAEFDVKRSKIRFELEWEDLTSPAVAAHIHCAVKGVNGPVGVTLFAGPMDTEGKVKGSFTAPDPGNPCGWATNADVLTAMISGGAYVNVHSQDFPGGEIRGQVKID